MKAATSPILPLTFLLLLAGCGGSDTHKITESRPLNETEQTPKLVTSSAERFDIFVPASMRQSQRPQASIFIYDLPEGWTEAEAPGAMRDVDLRFGKDGEGEIYVARAGGSLEDNVNRWRKQMGLEPESSEALASLPTVALLGRPAPKIVLDGTFTGMGGADAQEDYRMLGAILQYPEFSVFVKMVGPQELVEKNEEEFEAFCSSLNVRS